jgi:hypothetical protein
MSSRSGLIIFPLCPRGRFLSAECVDGKIKGLASGRRGGQLHKVNLTPALDPHHLEVGGGLHHSLHLEGSPGSVSASLILWRAILPFTLKEGLFRWASSRFIFGAGSLERDLWSGIFFFSSTALLLLFALLSSF